MRQDNTARGYEGDEDSFIGVGGKHRWVPGGRELRDDADLADEVRDMLANGQA